MEISVRASALSLLLVSVWALSSAEAQPAATVTRNAGILTLHQTIEREIGPGQTDEFIVDVAAGQFFHLAVEMKGVDVAVAVTDPARKTIVSVDALGNGAGLVPASLIADRAGAYTVHVTKSAGSRETGTYQIQLLELQAPTAQSRVRLQAEREFRGVLDTGWLRDPQKRGKYVDGYKKSAALWHSLSDSRSEALCLRRLGTIYKSSGDRQKSLEAYTRALTLWRAAGDRLNEAATLAGIAGVYSSPLEQQKSLNYYEQALPLFRDSGDRVDEASTFMSIASLYGQIGEQRKARDNYMQGLLLWHSVGDRTREAGALSQIGGIHENFGERREALDSFKQGLELTRLDGEPVAMAAALGNIGFSYMVLAENHEAMDYYQQALPLFRAAKNNNGEALTLANLGTLHSRLGEKQQGVDYFNEALTVYRGISGATGKAGEVRMLNAISQVYSDLGEESRAADYRKQATALSPKPTATPPVATLTALMNAGRDYLARGEQQKAADSFDRALAQARAEGYRMLEAGTLVQIGSDYHTRGELSKALDYSNQALPLTRAAEHHAAEAVTLSLIADAYLFTGEPRKSLDYNTEALTLARSLGDVATEASLGIGIGFAHWELGDLEMALASYKEALPIEMALNNRDGQERALAYIGIVLMDLGKEEEATTYYTQALSLFRVGDDRQTEAIARTGLGRVSAKLGDKQGALISYTQALRLARETSNPALQGIVLGDLMNYWAAERNVGLAIFFGKQAVNQSQDMRRNIQGLNRESQESYLTTVSKSYRALADLLIEQGRLSEAEQVLALLKQKEYFDYVRRDSAETSINGGASLNAQEAEADKREHSISEVWVALGVETTNLIAKPGKTEKDKQRIIEVRKLLEESYAAFDKFLTELPEHFSAKSTEVSVLALRESEGLTETLRELPPGTVAIHTLVGEDKFREILDTPYVRTAYDYPIKDVDLNRKISEFRQVIQDPTADPRPLAEDLYKILIGPIEKELKAANAKTLMWSLDGTLRYLPLAALYDGERYLIEDFDLSVMTLASNDRLKDHPDQQWKAAGFGVTKSFGDEPALPAVSAELAGIIATKPGDAGVLTGEVKVDGDFTRDTMEETLSKKYPVVHIATHFRLEPGNEAQSFLLLGDGGHFTLADLKTYPALFSGVQLLTLSACNTGVGDGSEVEGFGTLAQRKGAKAVIASLWPVADDSTSRLMQEFYSIRESPAGLTKLEALREAQLELLHGGGKPASASSDRGLLIHSNSNPKPDAPSFPFDPKAPYSHPYYWAPFFLMGNWL